MQNQNSFCSIQGHMEAQSNFICIFKNCQYTYRLMCDNCIHEKLHQHDVDINFTYTQTQFMEFFNNERLPQLELRLKSQNGIQVKQNYLQKLYSQLAQIQEDSDQNLLNNLGQKIVSMKAVIQDYINISKTEIIQAQEINNIYQELTLNGLASLNNNKINNLLSNHCEFFNKEIQLYKNMMNLVDEFYDIIYNKNYNKQCNKSLKKLKEISMKIVKLKQYINYQEQFKSIDEQKDIYFTQLSANNRYLAIFNENYQLKIIELDSIKIIRQTQFKKMIQKLQIDSHFKQLIIVNENNYLCYYIINNRKSFKLIKKHKQKNEFNEYYLINLNKIVCHNYFKIQQIDFKNRCFNLFQLDIELQIDFIQSSCYCREKDIFGVVFKNQVFKLPRKSLAITYGYQDYDDILFSVIINEEIRQMIFTNNCQQLLTEDYKHLCQWKINYQDRTLQIINRIANYNSYIWVQQNFTQFKIIRYYLCYIELLDQNLHLWFRIYSVTFEVIIRNQDILIGQGDGRYVILRQAKNDYEMLEQ